MTNIEPLSGFRDFNQANTAARRWLIERVLKTYRQFGYLPIETPTIEREEILRGQYGQEGEKLRYRFKDNGNREVGLRYDLTVPFARFVARSLASQQMRLPFRRSQVQPVFRAESPQAGRYREFTQCDYDIAGADTAEADSEALLVAASLARELGLNYQIKVSSRELLEAVLAKVGVPDSQSAPVLIALDKLEKIGPEAVKVDLIKLGLVKEVGNKLLDLIKSPEKLVSDLSTEGRGVWKRLDSILGLVKKVLPDSDRVVFDPSLARGLSYYTGIVFEAVDLDEPALGSFIGGGRYDDVIGLFANRKIPAVGASLGVDRTLEIMAKKGLLPKELDLTDVAVLPMVGQEKVAWELAQKWRQQGLTVSFCTQVASVSEMLGYAARTSRFAAVVGEKEVSNGEYKLKNLQTKTEIFCNFDKVARVISQYYERTDNREKESRDAKELRRG